MKHKRIQSTLLILLILSLSSTTATALLSPQHDLHIQTDTTSPTLLIGQTELTGNFLGMPYDLSDQLDTEGLDQLLQMIAANPLLANLIDIQFLEDLTENILEDATIFPFITNTTLQTIDTVMLLPTDLLSVDYTSLTLQELGDLLGSIQTYNDVRIHTTGPTIYSTTQPLSIQHTDICYNALFHTSFGETQSSLLGMYTTTPLHLSSTQGYAALFQPSSNSSIQIIDTTDTIVWSGSATELLISLEYNEDLQIIEQSPLHLIPLNQATNQSIGSLRVSPAQTPPIPNITALQQNINSLASGFGADPEGFSSIIELLNDNQDIVEIASSLLNSALILPDTTNATVSINTQPINTTGPLISRGGDTQIIITGGDSTAQLDIQTTSTMTLYNNHLYNSQAPTSSLGLGIPFLLIIIWAAALVIYFFFKGEETADYTTSKLPTILLITTLLSIVFCFTLLDMEINSQLGLSAFSLLSTQGLGLFSLGLLIIELILTLLGALALSIPISIITSSILKKYQPKKTAKGIAHTICPIGIWLFAALYTPLLLNILLMMFTLPFSM